MSTTIAKPLTDNMATIICVREYAAAHEKFLFALQDKHEELAKYAQRKDASTYVIDKGNKELRDCADYMNKSEAIIKALTSQVRLLLIEKKLNQLRNEL